MLVAGKNMHGFVKKILTFCQNKVSLKNVKRIIIPIHMFHFNPIIV